MAYAIFLVIFLVCLIGLIIACFCYSDAFSGICLMGLIVSFVICLIWTFCGGYKYISEPTYDYILVEEVGIPEFDTKKKDEGKHDVVYIDTNNYIVYIDETVNDKKRVTLHYTDEARLEIYHCIPKNNSTSVDILFNRHYEYKVYVPENYKVVTINLK